MNVIGNPDNFKLLSKSSCDENDFMKSTKAMQIDGVGCVVQVTTRQGNNVAEALTYVPGVKIVEDVNNGYKLVSISENVDNEVVSKSNKVIFKIQHNLSGDFFISDDNRNEWDSEEEACNAYDNSSGYYNLLGKPQKKGYLGFLKFYHQDTWKLVSCN